METPVRASSGYPVSTRLFGTILPPDSILLDGYINGLREANTGFLGALLEHSQFFQHFHFFIGEGDIEARQAFWDNWLAETGSSKAVTVLPLQSLAASFSIHTYDLFYAGDPHFSYLMELRDAFAQTPFPLVGRTHSLNQDISLGAWRSLGCSPSKPYDAVICSSQAARQVVDNLLEETARRGDVFQGQRPVIPLGVPDMGVACNLNQKQAREVLGLPEDKVIILCLGRLSPVDKADLHPLLTALAEARDRHGANNCCLYICGQTAGDEDYVFSLARLAGQLGIESQVFFNFDLEAGQKAVAYKAVDAFVSIADSVQESFGLAPVEAMSANLPVILSDWNGYKELIEQGVQGEKIPSIWGDIDGLCAPSAFFDASRAHFIQAQSVAVDISALAESIARLSSDSQLRAVMGEEGRKRFLECYQWQHVIAQFDDIVETLCEQARKDKAAPTSHLHSLHYHRIFADYGSTTLQLQSLKTTLSGRQLLSGQAAPVWFEGLKGAVPIEHLSDILNVCLKGFSVSQIRQHFIGNASLARAQVDSLLLWAMKHGFIKTDSAKAPLTNSRIKRHYQRRQSLRAAQALKVLLNRVEEGREQLQESFGLSGEEMTTIKPLTSKGYRGACRLTFNSGINLLYKPSSMKMEAAFVQKNGLSQLFNQWLGQSVIAEQSDILTCEDCRGSYGFRPYYSAENLSPQSDMARLGLLSALAVFCGLSDLHGGNVLSDNGELLLVDLDMLCDSEVLSRLRQELAEQKIERWQASSLSATRIELLWDGLLAQGWMPEESDVDDIVQGFIQGGQVFLKQAQNWKMAMLPLTQLPCRFDPVPFNTAAPIIEQMEQWDLDATSSFAELKSDLRVQAARALRHLGLGGEYERLVPALLKSWMKGEHLTERYAPGESVRLDIQSIAESNQSESAGAGLIQLSALYRECLRERFGLD